MHYSLWEYTAHSQYLCSDKTPAVNDNSITKAADVVPVMQRIAPKQKKFDLVQITLDQGFIL